MSLSTLGRNLTIGLATMFAAFYGSYRIMGQPDSKDERIAYLRDHGDEYDILFFGTSITRYNVDPFLFEQSLAARGYQARCFTFGQDAADMHQIDWAIRRVLAMKPERLRYVFVEVRDFEFMVRNRYRYTATKIRWHDLTQTLSAIKTVELSDRPAFEKGIAKSDHWRYFLYKYFPVGMLIRGEFTGEVEALNPELQGHIPVNLETPMMSDAHRTFLGELESYEERVERKRNHEYDEFDLATDYNLAALEKQRELIEAAGVEVIYWTGPSTHEYDFAYALRSEGILPDMLVFDDAEKYPGLFDPMMRLDPTHLNAEGTRVFTPLLAKEMVDRFGGDLDLSRIAATPVQE